MFVSTLVALVRRCVAWVDWDSSRVEGRIMGHIGSYCEEFCWGQNEHQMSMVCSPTFRIYRFSVGIELLLRLKNRGVVRFVGALGDGRYRWMREFCRRDSVRHSEIF